MERARNFFAACAHSRMARMEKCLFLLFLTLGYMEGSVHADHFVLRGNVVAKFYSRSGAIETRQDIKFEALLEEDGEPWLLRTFFGADTNWFYETFGTGSAVYNVHYNPTVNASWDMPGSIYPGYYPYLSVYHVTVPWGAYCSSLFFHNEAPATTPALVYIAASEPIAHGCAATVTFLANEKIKLPNTITWVADEERMKTANFAEALRQPLNESERKGQRKDLRYVMKPGSVMAEYEVTSLTNHAGATFPLSFTLKNYKNARSIATGASGMKPEHTVFSRYLKSEFRGHLESVLLSPGRLQVPAFPKRVSVADYRFSDKSLNIAYLNYQISDAKWTTQTNSHLRQLSEKQKAQARKRLATGWSGKVYQLGFLLVFIIPPVIFAFHQLAKKHEIQHIANQ